MDTDVPASATPSKKRGRGLTCKRSEGDFQRAYRAKKRLIEKQKEDFLFRLGKQWDNETVAQYNTLKIKPVTDNRIAPNVNLLSGMERQNRTDWKAYPEGQEDSLKAAVASGGLKDTVKKSDFGYKGSECFEDGVTCGESALEMYLDWSDSIFTGKPKWKKIDANQVFPEPGWKEYDYSDARYIYKITKGLSEDDLISLFPEKRKIIEEADGGRFDIDNLLSKDEEHTQHRDYPKTGDSTIGDDTEPEDDVFDLLERYYKKPVEKVSIIDYKTGEIRTVEDDEDSQEDGMKAKEKAEAFILKYQEAISAEQEQYQQELMEYQAAQLEGVLPEGTPSPQEPNPKDPKRFTVSTQPGTEIWYFAHVPGIDQPLADEKAWFYPKWRSWSIVPFFAHFSTAPIDGEDAHLKIQGIVRGVKESQELHNKAESIKLLIMQSTANSGWLEEEDSWVDPQKVEQFGARPGINLSYKKGRPEPKRITPAAAPAGWERDSETRAEAIKAQLGINADLLAVQEGGTDSGRAIALRQKQGVIMVQKLFDNWARTKQICGRMALSQLGEIYDTETLKKVLGDAFLKKNFPPLTQPVQDESGNLVEKPVLGPDGKPMSYDAELADLVIKDVLSGDLGQYDVSIGEAVASDTMLMAQQSELKDYATMYPMAFTPDMLIEHSNLPETLKGRAIANVQKALTAPTAPLPGKTSQGNPGLAA